MNSPRTNYINPGEYNVVEVIMESTLLKDRKLDIGSIWTAMSVFENIFTNTLTGNIILTDTHNLLSNFPVVGHETISINIESPDIEGATPIKRKFRVYRVSDVTDQGESTKRYMVNFISEEYFTNMKTSVSKSYNDHVISDIVEKIFDSYLDSDRDLFIEKTKNKYDIIIPFWKPLEAFNWLSARATPENRDGANYFFYETRDGFCFKSMESLFDQEPEEIYSWDLQNMPDFTGRRQPDMEAYRKLDSYELASVFDMVEKIPRGTYASRLVIHDMLKKKIETVDFDYGEGYKNYSHLEKTKNKKTWVLADGQIPSQDTTMLVGDGVDGLTTSPLSQQSFISRHGDKNKYDETTLQIRNSQLEQLHSIQTNVTIPGDTTRQVGDVIKLLLPSAENPYSEDVSEDALYSGNYLISGLRHRFTADKHEMIMELLKDSYYNSLPKEN